MTAEHLGIEAALPLRQLLRTYSQAVGVLVLAIVGVFLVGEGFFSAGLRFHPFSGLASGGAFGLLGASFALLLAHEQRGTWQTRMRLLVASALVVVSLATLLSGSFLASPAELEAGRHEGWMAAYPSPYAAAVLLFIGLALLLLDLGAKQGPTYSEWFALAAGFIAFLGLLGHLYSVRGLYHLPASSSLNIYGLTVMLALITGIMAARPHRGLMALLSGDTAGGYLARRLLPAALFLPPFLGWLRLEGQRAGLYGLEFGLALFAAANVVTFAVLVVRSAGSLGALDVRRRLAETALQRANEELEARVSRRTVELEEANGSLRLEVLKRERTEQKFRGFLESAPDAIIVVDTVGRIVLVNAQAELWFGYGREELMGRSIEVLVPPGVRGRHGDLRKGYAVHPHARPMGQGMALHAQRKDGSEFPVEISLSPLETAEGMLVTAIVRDISERRRSELAREEMQERYRQLVDNLPVGVFRNTPGPEGSFAEANPALAAMFDAASSEELMVHRVRDLYRNPADRLRFSQKLLREQAVIREELELLSLSGRPFWGAVTAALKKSDTGEMFFDGVIEDITRSKEAEQAIRDLNEALVHRNAELETLNEELESFSYSVSHDLRAPLRAIDGFSQAVLEDYGDKIDADGHDALRRLRAAAQRMGMLIDDLLKLARVTRAEMVREEVDLSALAAEVVEELRRRDPGRQVEVDIETGMRARGDGRLLQIVLDNLLGNAWKFSARCNAAHIQVGVHEEAGERAYFVRDNGVGFDMAFAKKLFGAFQRLHDARDFPGTGIGLATVQRIVRKHGGRIWGHSEVGSGATFYFTL